MALKENTNSFRSHMLGDWEWYRGMPAKGAFGDVSDARLRSFSLCSSFVVEVLRRL